MKIIGLTGGIGSGKSTVLEAIKLLLDMMFGENKIALLPYTSLLSKRSGFSLEYGFRFQEEEIVYNFSYSSHYFTSVSV